MSICHVFNKNKNFGIKWFCSSDLLSQTTARTAVWTQVKFITVGGGENNERYYFHTSDNTCHLTMAKFSLKTLERDKTLSSNVS